MYFFFQICSLLQHTFELFSKKLKNPDDRYTIILY